MKKIGLFYWGSTLCYPIFLCNPHWKSYTLFFIFLYKSFLVWQFAPSILILEVNISRFVYETLDWRIDSKHVLLIDGWQYPICLCLKIFLKSCIQYCKHSRVFLYPYLSECIIYVSVNWIIPVWCNICSIIRFHAILENGVDLSKRNAITF